MKRELDPSVDALGLVRWLTARKQRLFAEDKRFTFDVARSRRERPRDGASGWPAIHRRAKCQDVLRSIRVAWGRPHGCCADRIPVLRCAQGASRLRRRSDLVGRRCALAAPSRPASWGFTVHRGTCGSPSVEDSLRRHEQFTPLGFCSPPFQPRRSSRRPYALDPTRAVMT